MSMPETRPAITPLRQVTIHNFRGIGHMELDLDPRVTVLFGSNAAGKTTVLDALAIGLGALASRVPKVKGRGFAQGDLRFPLATPRPQGPPDPIPPSPAPSPHATATPKPLNLSWIEIPPSPAPFAYVNLTSDSGVAWEIATYRSPADATRHRRKPLGSGLRDAMDALVLEALEAPPGGLTSPLPLVAAYGTERAVVDVPLRERDFRGEFERFEAYAQSLLARTRFKAVFEWFRVMEDEERRQREARRDFDYRLPALEWVRAAVERSGLRCRNPRVETQPLRMVVEFFHADGKRQTLDIKSLSDGYRTHFALVVDLARRMVQLNPSEDLTDPERGTNSPAVVLIDEVDLHLDPTWQATVVTGLLAAFPNAQFVLTTHSEQVIGSVEASCVRHLAWNNGEIVAEPVPFAQGATGERILIDLMGAPERVPGPITTQLGEYLALVERGLGQESKAKQLRHELDEVLPGDSRLHQADLEMQRRELLGKLKGGGR